jgi:NAD(P)-dependent dehydrogenase (short-subunit alcohol dehydrogenase family)
MSWVDQSQELQPTVVIITGANSEIGFYMAEELLKSEPGRQSAGLED